MEEEEEPNYSTSLSKYSPLYGVPGWVRGERAQQIARCFALNNATSYIWGQDTPQFRPLLNGISISQIACGSTHVAFLTSMGQVYTFGGNEVFQCGLGEDSAPFVEQPTLVTDLVQSQVSSIACGPAQTAAIVSETEFYLWGVEVCSQKRQGTPQEFLQWNKIGENKTLQQIHLGPQHVSIVVKVEDQEATEVWAWGASNRGLLGISADSHAKSNPTNLTPRGGQDKIKRQPVLVAGLHGEQVEQLAGSETHMVALTADGRVFAWGQNLDGFLGVERESFIVGAPVIVEGLDGVHVVQVSCGDNFTVCVAKDGETYSWGQNDKGQLGLGTTESTTIPTQITSLDDEEEICAVLCGSAHSCALTIERKSLLWGCGNDYCINPVSVDDALFPTELAACPVGISLGSNFTVAVFGTLEEIMDIPPYEKEEKKALPDLRALAGMSPEMKRRDRKRRQSGMSSRSIVISKDQTKNVKKQMSEEMVHSESSSEDTILLPPVGKLATTPLPSPPPSNIPPAIAPSHLIPASPTTPLPLSPSLIRPISPGLPLPLSQSFSTTPAPLCKTPSPSSQLPPPVNLPPPPSTHPSPGPIRPTSTPPQKSLPRTHSKSLTMDNLLAAQDHQSSSPVASPQIPPSHSPPPAQANKRSSTFATSAPDIKKETPTPLSMSVPTKGLPPSQQSAPSLPKGRVMNQRKPPPPGISSPASPPLEKKGGLRIAMVQKERQKREPVNQEPPRSSRGPVIPAKITQKQTGTIALPHLVMSNTAPLQVRFKIIRADGISAETPRCRLSLSRDAVRTQKSAVFQTPFADPPAFSWNHTLDLSVTKQEGDWYFTLESEGKAIPLALFCINVLELRNKANIPEEVTLQDIGDNNINLIVAVTTVNWSPAVSESKQQTTPKEKIPVGEPVDQSSPEPEQKKKRRLAHRPLSDMRSSTISGSTRSMAERKRDHQKRMSKRKSMLSMKGLTGRREQSLDVSGPSNYQHVGSGPELMTVSTPIELNHRPPSARGKEKEDGKKKKKKAKYAEVGELSPEGFYVIKVLDSSGKDVGYIRALSSGRFAIGSDVGEDLTAVDQEYLFQHFHITMKRKGAEVDLSGLKNVKYEKFMSRPHVGQKLMATNILAAREMINTFDSKWTMFKDTKLKDPLPICLSDPTKGTDDALLAVSKTTTLSFTLISTDEKPVELSSSFALLSPDQLKRGAASQQ